MSCRVVVSPFTANADKVTSEEFLTIKKNNVKDRKHLSFTCDLGEMGEDAVIRIGHGFEMSCGSWIEITKKTLSAFSYYSWTDPKKHSNIDNLPLDFELSKFLTVAIDKDIKAGGTFIVIMSAGGMMKIDAGGLSGDIGEVFVSPVNCELKNCKLNWLADGYGDPIWIFGDSYLSMGAIRWPFYLYRDGYSKVLLAGYSGMKTGAGLEDFKVALEKGTPKFAFWCLGMNNGDDKETGAVNETWLEPTKEFLAICEEKGITPILSTIPSTPVVLNEPKNVWVRNWAKETGGRYVDFARAVGADTFIEGVKGEKKYVHRNGNEIVNQTGYEWYEGMICPDYVHPVESGAQALYAQVLVDFPEIMNR